jgi:hypothetical protein
MVSAIFYFPGMHPPDHGLDRPRTHGKFIGLPHAIEMHERYIAKRYGKSGVCPKDEHPPVNIQKTHYKRLLLRVSSIKKLRIPGEKQTICQNPWFAHVKNKQWVGLKLFLCVSGMILPATSQPFLLWSTRDRFLPRENNLTSASKINLVRIATLPDCLCIFSGRFWSLAYQQPIP